MLKPIKISSLPEQERCPCGGRMRRVGGDYMPTAGLELSDQLTLADQKLRIWHCPTCKEFYQLPDVHTQFLDEPPKDSKCPECSSVLSRSNASGIVREDDGPETYYWCQGARGIPANVPQLVQVGPKIAQHFWMDRLVTVVETQFQRPSRERPHVEVYRTWAQDLVSSFRLEFDWDEYTRTLPDKEVIRTQLLVTEVLRILTTKPQEPKSPAR